MNRYRVFVFSVTLWAVFLSVGTYSIKAAEKDKKRVDLTDWLITVLGPDHDLKNSQEDKTISEVELILMANTLCSRKEYQKAVEIYKKTLEEFESPDAAYNLGLTYEINLNNPSLALLYYSKFLSLEPESPDVEAVRMWMQNIKKKKQTPTHKKEETASKTLPMSSEEKKTLGIVLRTGPPVNKEDILPDRAETGMSFLRTGNENYINARYKEAIEDFIRVLDYFDSTDAYYNLGVTYHLKLNNPEQAVRFYSRYLEIDSYSTTAHEVKKLLEQAETSILFKKLQEEKEEALKVIDE